jgi:hypothetical protein
MPEDFVYSNGLVFEKALTQAEFKERTMYKNVIYTTDKETAVKLTYVMEGQPKVYTLHGKFKMNHYRQRVPTKLPDTWERGCYTLGNVLKYAVVCERA